jgi:hypothetical protein
MDKQRKEMAGFVCMEPNLPTSQRLSGWWLLWWDEMYATEW